MREPLGSRLLVCEFGRDLGPDCIQLSVAEVAAFDVAGQHERCPTLHGHSALSVDCARSCPDVTDIAEKDFAPLPVGEVMQRLETGVDIAASPLRPLGQFVKLPLQGLEPSRWRIRQRVAGVGLSVHVPVRLKVVVVLSDLFAARLVGASNGHPSHS